MKKRFLGILLCFCMLVGIMPTSVMALWDSDTVVVKDAVYYDSGALKKFTAEFDWSDATATGRLVMMSKALRSGDEEGAESYYGDFTDFGYYHDSFTNFDEVIAYDNENQTFGITSYSDESTVWYDKTNTLEISFDEDTLPLDKDDIYYVYLWTYYGGQIYPDTLICVIRVQDGEVKYSAATGRNSYSESEFAAIESQKLYSVKVVPAENMSITSTSGAELQNDLTGEMTPVVYTADTGYYFPEDYSVDTVNGIMVRRDSQNKITVYGTPTANVEITLTAPTQIVDTTDYLASVTFDGSTTGYATIDEAWAAAIALQTTETKKATITLLDNCTAADVLHNQSDYLVLNTNGKTLTICELPTQNDYIYYSGIKVSGGSLMINGNGKVTGLADGNYYKSIIYAGGGVVYVDGAEFHFLDGHIRSGNEYALNANLFAEVYLYSGTIEGNGSLVISSTISRFVKICYSDKPLYLLNRTQDKIIQYSRHRSLNDNVGMDLEYSDNYSGKNSTTITNATEISDTVSRGCYIKIQTFKKYTVTATAGTGGTVSGGGDVKEGESITLTALSDDDYTFGGWYDGETKVSDEAVFTAENVTEDKTYTAKFTANQTAEPDPTPTPEPTPEPTPSELDFTSLRTLKTKNITVNHQTKTIDIEAANGAEYITILVHQKEVIPDGTFKMASYMGNDVVYNSADRTYTITKENKNSITVKTKITMLGETRYYDMIINFAENN